MKYWLVANDLMYEPQPGTRQVLSVPVLLPGSEVSIAIWSAPPSAWVGVPPPPDTLGVGMLASWVWAPSSPYLRLNKKQFGPELCHAQLNSRISDISSILDDISNIAKLSPNSSLDGLS